MSMKEFGISYLGVEMILPDFYLTTRKDLKIKFSGIDSIEECLNKKHFLEYPYDVDYSFNSRGYRDHEWPDSSEELTNAIWCFGDSFTVGVGSPVEFSWPSVLGRKVNKRCINVSMDGASNDWISRRVSDVIKTIQPSKIVVLWSYFHRREKQNNNLTDEARRIFYDNTSDLEDFLNFKKCYTEVINLCKEKNIKSAHGVIPRAYKRYEIQQSWHNIKDASWPGDLPATKEMFEILPEYIRTEITKVHRLGDDFENYYLTLDFLTKNNILDINHLDFARDYHHFDLITSEHFTDFIINQLRHS